MSNFEGSWGDFNQGEESGTCGLIGKQTMDATQTVGSLLADEQARQNLLTLKFGNLRFNSKDHKRYRWTDSPVSEDIVKFPFKVGYST